MICGEHTRDGRASSPVAITQAGRDLQLALLAHAASASHGEPVVEDRLDKLSYARIMIEHAPHAGDTLVPALDDLVTRWRWHTDDQHIHSTNCCRGTSPLTQ